MGRCLLDAELDHSRFNLVLKIRNSLIFGMLYILKYFSLVFMLISVLLSPFEILGPFYGRTLKLNFLHCIQQHVAELSSKFLV